MAEEQPVYGKSPVEELRAMYAEALVGKREVRVVPTVHMHPHAHEGGDRYHTHEHRHDGTGGYAHDESHEHEHEDIPARDEQDIDGRATCVHEDAVKWNLWNRVVQCHRCGQVFVPEDATAVPPPSNSPLTPDEHLKRGHLHYWSIQYTISSGSRAVAHRQSIDDVAMFIRLMLEGALAGVPTEQSAVTISSHWFAPESLPAEE